MSAPLLTITSGLGDKEVRRLIRDVLKIADRHVKAKRPELALETVRLLRNSLEPTPVTLTHCTFHGAPPKRARRK